MNATPLVSYLVPIYNVEKYLESCLESIFGQTYQNTEYVFVDDCSTDNSYDVLLSTLKKNNIPQEKYTIVRHPQNEGIAVSRTDCIANAKGEYVQFVDSDDWIEPDMTETMVAAADRGTIDIIGCDFNRIYSDGQVVYDWQNYSDDSRENLFRCINYGIGTFLWKLLIRRELFEKIKIDKEINIGEDYIISIKLFFYAKSFVAIHKALYNYVSFNGNRLTNRHLQSLSEHILAVGKVEEFLAEYGLLAEAIAQEVLLRKFNIKRHFLYRPFFLPKRYLTTFPEANGMWKNQSYTKNDKFKFWLTENLLRWVL